MVKNSVIVAHKEMSSFLMVFIVAHKAVSLFLMVLDFGWTGGVEICLQTLNQLIIIVHKEVLLFFMVFISVAHK